MLLLLFYFLLVYLKHSQLCNGHVAEHITDLTLIEGVCTSNLQPPSPTEEEMEEGRELHLKKTLCLHFFVAIL